ncbi:protein-export chaperone SecB [Allofrancisella guangzhouensis]|uniref:Protein-export protein SecB n=1 Tax=Allofrancisella guangzhouensis TaxID=594679 RepID=A0A0A8E532_9GAMM|nr:protein-export chaperone SecB [Allofrancisella guangzhouensis]AJC48707.1 preprotein translocase subunit SecB [Allofrancisella guangzhouensis]MBK2026801.1 protein-export chaperone SecB [Allofrancisella guangzhouensis]MBK2044058.1 protein-export chaperone SecB [Allofrancisella guangzhouensis]MBK2045170.1 protein-export chaperone SecB [Allofrancisella guangzhouensis]
MQNDKSQPSFLIQKVYTKDVSFETINSPANFKEQWDPTSDFNIDINTKKINTENFELDLTITITTKNNNNNVYIVEVTQSGLFTITNMPDEQIDSVLNTYCANTLFPYAKRIIDSSIIKGGFLPLNLVPINFDAIYLQKKSQQPEH